MRPIDETPVSRLENLYHGRTNMSVAQLAIILGVPTLTEREAAGVRMLASRLTVELRHALEEGRASWLLYSDPTPAPEDKENQEDYTLAEAERRAYVRAIRRALDATQGHRHRAAELLGISEVSLWRRMREFGFVVRDQKRGKFDSTEQPTRVRRFRESDPTVNRR